ncbi:MAG TPA: DUF2442 domain-containing protein [Ktedonobacterales bacterium]|jgi:hypothetical protein
MIPQPLSVRAVGVRFDHDRLFIQLEDGREISAPLVWFPRLEHATSAERADWRLIGTGQGIHWEQVDEDISPAILLGLLCE